MKSGEWKDGWFVVPHDVLFSDIDLFGHVNNAVFLTYFEIGRTYLWFDLMGTRDPREISFIVARAEVDFRKQIGMEEIEIATRIARLGNTSMEFVAEIRKGDEVAATGRVIAVLYDWARRSKVEVSKELRRRVEEHAVADPSSPGAAAVS